MKISTAINAHKALVIPVVVGLMYWYQNWSTEAFVYLALHGTYSLLWLTKHALFRDRRFEEEKPLGIAVFFIFLPLAGYYAAPYLLISRHLVLPPALVGLVIALFVAAAGADRGRALRAHAQPQLPRRGAHLLGLRADGGALAAVGGARRLVDVLRQEHVGEGPLAVAAPCVGGLPPAHRPVLAAVARPRGGRRHARPGPIPPALPEVGPARPRRRWRAVLPLRLPRSKRC